MRKWRNWLTAVVVGNGIAAVVFVAVGKAWASKWDNYAWIWSTTVWAVYWWLAERGRERAQVQRDDCLRMAHDWRDMYQAERERSRP